MKNRLVNNYCWVIKQINVNHKVVFCLIFVSLLASIFAIAEAYTIKYILDELLLGNFDKSVCFVLLFGAIILSNKVTGFVLELLQTKHIKIPLSEKLSNSVISKLFSLSEDNINRRGSTFFVDTVVKDISYVSDGISEIFSFFGAFINLILLLVLVSVINPVLIIIIFVLCLIYVLLGDFLGNKYGKANSKYLEKTTKLHAIIEECISSTREVLSFDRLLWEKKRYDEYFDQYYEESKNLYKVGFAQYITTDTVKWAISIIGLVCGSFLVFSGRLEISLFIVSNKLFVSLLETVQRIYSQTLNLYGVSVRIERIRTIINDVTTKNNKEDIYDSINKVISIDYDDVTYLYDNSINNGISHINFSINKEGKYAFVGPCGSGKSTLIRLLLGIDDCKKGNIYINGINLCRISEECLRKKISICMQEPFMLPDSIINNILLGRNVDFDTVKDCCKKMQIYDFIMSLPDKFDTVLGERGITLSGGQRQRIALVRAIIGDPDVLILDEATSSLDMITEYAIQKNLDEIMKDKIMVVVAHRLKTIENAQEIYVLDNGVIVERGTHGELLNQKGVYFELLQTLSSKGEIS